MSCHNIGHGLNEVVFRALVEYDAGLISYESVFRILQQCVKSVYWCDGNEHAVVVVPILGILYNDRELLDLVRKETIDCHLCQDRIDKLGIREFTDSSWNVEKETQYDYHG